MKLPLTEGALTVSTSTPTTSTLSWGTSTGALSGPVTLHVDTAKSVSGGSDRMSTSTYEFSTQWFNHVKKVLEIYGINPDGLIKKPAHPFWDLYGG